VVLGDDPSGWFIGGTVPGCGERLLCCLPITFPVVASMPSMSPWLSGNYTRLSAAEAGSVMSRRQWTWPVWAERGDGVREVDVGVHRIDLSVWRAFRWPSKPEDLRARVLIRCDDDICLGQGDLSTHGFRDAAGADYVPRWPTEWDRPRGPSGEFGDGCRETPVRIRDDGPVRIAAARRCRP
jgi:hypothetical protein